MVEREQGGTNAGDSDEDDSESSPKNRTGRFSLIHRGGTRVEVSDPILLPVGVGTDKPWLCAVKLLGAKKGGDDDDSDQQVTQTLLVRTGRGNTPEEAQRDAMAQLSLMYGTPTAAPPSVVITRKPSEPPPPPPATAKKGVWGFLSGLFGKRK